MLRLIFYVFDNYLVILKESKVNELNRKKNSTRKKNACLMPLAGMQM